MTDTETLIAELSQSAPLSKPSGSPWGMTVKWVLAAAAYLVVILSVIGLRDDFAAKLHASLYMAELAALMAVFIASALSAATLSFPDLHQKPSLVYIPAAPVLIFLLVLIWEWHADNPPSPMPEHSFTCLACITLYSTLPAAFIMAALRRQASVHYYSTGAIALLAATSLGCLVLRFSEKTDSILHLIEWHYLPVAGFSLLGIALGRKFLRW